MWRLRAHGGSFALVLANEEQRAPGILVPSVLILNPFSYMCTWAFSSKATLLPSLHTCLKHNYFPVFNQKKQQQDFKKIAKCHSL